MSHNFRHQCLIYSGAPSEHLAAIGNILIHKLKAGYRCLYLNSPAMVSGLRSYLAAAGIDLKGQTSSGALLLSSDQSHLIDGRFEVDPMISMLKSAALRSHGEGFVGLWASGDMTWEFGGEKNLKKLLEYECRLEQLFHEVPALSGICQYHMQTLPSEAIQSALYTHQGVFINESLSRANPHYVASPPACSEPVNRSRPGLQRMLEALELPPYPSKAEDTFL